MMGLRLAPSLTCVSYIWKKLFLSRNLRNFRNKVVEVTYNPEFNTYRLYQAYSDYNDLIDLTADLIFSMAKYIIGRLPSTPKAYET